MQRLSITIEPVNATGSVSSTVPPLKFFLDYPRNPFQFQSLNFDPLRGHPEADLRASARARAEAEAEEERASTAAACIADPPSIWQLVAYGPNA